MTKITFPTNTRETIDSIRAVIGREITIFVPVSGIPCTTCGLDPVTNLSTDPFCIECGGNYWKETLSGWLVSGHVRWRGAYQPYRVPGGIIEEGDCTVTIAHSGSALSNVQNSEYYLVDGVTMYMKNFKLRGVPEPNRITITLLEDKG